MLEVAVGHPFYYCNRLPLSTANHFRNFWYMYATGNLQQFVVKRVKKRAANISVDVSSTETW